MTTFCPWMYQTNKREGEIFHIRCQAKVCLTKSPCQHGRRVAMERIRGMTHWDKKASLLSACRQGH